jgi:hypothetical protein
MWAGIAQSYSDWLQAGRSNDRGSILGGGWEFFSSTQTGSWAQSASYLMGTGALSLGVKRPGREANHLPPSSADVKEYVELYLHFPIRLNGVMFS